MLKPISYFSLLLCISACSLSSASSKETNVLFIAIDDLRPELNCYGASRIKSPHIDRLAEEGLLFERAYCQMAVCGPSRLSIMTGAYLDRLGVYGMSAGHKIQWRDTRKGITSLSEQFRKHGYKALCFGKIYDYRLGRDEEVSWDVIDGKRIGHFMDPNNQALERQAGRDRRAGVKNQQRRPAVESYDVPDEAYTDGHQAQQAIEFLQQRDRSQPFFLAVGFVKPHLPFVAPKKYWDLYERKDISLPEHTQSPQGSSRFMMSPYREIGDYDVQLPVSQDDTLLLRHGYYACVSYVDALVGRLLDTLKETGDLDNTIVVLWGDHGFKLGDFGRWAKHTNLETDTRVPLIIRLPDRKPTNKRSAALVELVDVMPTLCDAAGLPIPENVDGKSLLPLFANPEKEIKPFALSLYPRSGRVIGYSMRTDQWRYTEWLHYDSRKIVDQELYRMDHPDLMERTNVVEQFPHKVVECSEQLHVYLKRCEKWTGNPHGLRNE